VATFLNHSRKAVFGPKVTTAKSRETTYVNYASISDAVAASVSLPPVFAPYCIPDEDGKNYYFDGEIRDTLRPTWPLIAALILIILLFYPPYHYTKEVGL